VRIAQVPDAIRGFGHVKEAAMATAKADEAKLWAEWDAPSPSWGGTGGEAARAGASQATH